MHALDNVVVADSSVFVTSSGYGPTLTLVALAARAAHHLAGTDARAGATGGLNPQPQLQIEGLTEGRQVSPSPST